MRRATGRAAAVLLVLVAVAAVAGGVLAWQFLGSSQGEERLRGCQSQLVELGTAVREYARRTGDYPNDAGSLMESGLLANPALLHCPSALARGGSGASVAQSSYEFPRFRMPLATTKPDVPVLCDGSADDHRGGRNVLYADGTVAFVKAGFPIAAVRQRMGLQ
ncbi:MAG: hypothetical protein HY722_08805 [Planctomycetes bacterium]|nr:hypothetical protein [Planctomycetota bacterium]